LSINDINATADQKPLKILYFVPVLAVLFLVPVGFTSDQTDTIPPWIKGIAGVWVDGGISDAEFIDAIEFLIDGGIIQTDRIGELEEENERLRQELKSSSLSVQPPIPAPENTLNIGDKATMTIPHGWVKENTRDPFTGELLYGMTEPTTRELLIPTTITVSMSPAEYSDPYDQYAADWEDVKDVVLAVTSCLEFLDSGTYDADGGAYFWQTYRFNIDLMGGMGALLVDGLPSQNNCNYGEDEYQNNTVLFDNFSYGIDMLTIREGTSYTITYAGYGSTYDEFFDTFLETAEAIRFN